MAQTKKSLREVWNSIGGFTGLWREGCDKGTKIAARFENVGPENFWLIHCAIVAGISACSVAYFGFKAWGSKPFLVLGGVGVLGILAGILMISSYYPLFAMRSVLYGDYKFPSQKNTFRFLMFSVLIGFGLSIVSFTFNALMGFLSLATSTMGLAFSVIILAVQWGFSLLTCQLRDLLVFDYAAAMKPYFSFERAMMFIMTLPIYFVVFLCATLWGIFATLYVLLTRVLGPALVITMVYWLLQKGLVATELVSAAAFVKMADLMGVFIGGIFIYYTIIQCVKRAYPYSIGFVYVYYKHVGLVSSGCDEKHLKEAGSDDFNSF